MVRIWDKASSVKFQISVFSLYKGNFFDSHQLIIDSYSPILKSNLGGKNFGIQYLHKQPHLSFCPTLLVI